MSNFNTEDDFTPTNNYPTFDDYEHPEYGGTPQYGKIKKNPLGNLLDSILGAGKGLTIEKILLLIYVIALIIVIFNIETVLDVLFYATMSVLQYVIIIGVIVLLGYCVIKFIL